MNVMELARELETKRAEYKRRWDGYPTKVLADGQKSKDIPANDLEGLRKLMDDINDLSKKHEVMSGLEATGSDVEAKHALGGLPANRVVAGSSVALVDELFRSANWQSRVAGKFGDTELSDSALEFFCR